ncbi:DUF2795 domain-containing protein [Streptomyces sp. NPDC001719]
MSDMFGSGDPVSSFTPEIRIPISAELVGSLVRIFEFGFTWPASRKSLVEHATKKKLPTEQVDMLKKLPDRQYTSYDDLQDQLSKA